MSETLRGMQAEQAGYEATRDALEMLDAEIDTQTVEMYLAPAAGRTPEQMQAAVQRFEQAIRDGQRPQGARPGLPVREATILEIRRRLRVLAQMPAPEPLEQPTPREFELLRCRQCGQRGYAGQYPFSTLPGSGLCDDCC